MLLGDGVYTINPECCDHYQALFTQLSELNQSPTIITHLWNVTPENHLNENSQVFSYYSLIYLTQALGAKELTDACTNYSYI